MTAAEMNPWTQIWTQPRKTIRAIVNKNPRFRFFYLAAIYALQNLLFAANSFDLAKQYNVALIILVSLIVSPFIGAAFLYFNSWILYFTGKWMKGTAPFLHVRAALSWSKVPLIISILMWFILFVFSSDVVLQFSGSGATTIFINLVSIITGIWCFVILVQNIQEVQSFPAWKSVINIVLSFFISYAIVYAVSYLIRLVSLMF